MARSFRIYKKDGTKIAEGDSPLSITGVSPNTSVASGDYYAIAVENGYDSEPVNIPSFTTLPILATSVTLNKTTLTLDGGSSETLTATVLPANTTNKTVTWKSSNTAVATVSPSGVVSAVKGAPTGTANITATTTNGKVATCALTVTQYEVTVNGVAATAAYAPKDISQADYLALATKDTNTLYRVQPTDSGSGRVHFLGSQIVDLTKDKDGNVVYVRNYFTDAGRSYLSISGTPGALSIITLQTTDLNRRLSSIITINPNTTLGVKKYDGTDISNRLKVIVTKGYPKEGLFEGNGELNESYNDSTTNQCVVTTPEDSKWTNALIVYSVGADTSSWIGDFKAYITKTGDTPDNFVLAPEDLTATTDTGGGTFG